MTIEWSLTAVNDVIADAIPERDMLVWGDVRRTYGEVRDRTQALAGFFVQRAVGLRTERERLERWECGQTPVALVMDNRTEYIEAMLGAFRARAVPFNVNQHYTASEVGALFDLIGVGAVVYARRYAALVRDALGDRSVVLVDVDDDSGGDPRPGSVAYEAAIAKGEGTPLPTTDGDDLYLVCTGGTTGRPKAVSWRQADIFISAMAGQEGTTAASLVATVSGPGETWFAAPPMMHAAAQWTAFCGLHCGATVVLHDDSRPFDAAEILRVAERERITMISVVGDAYARPIVEELRNRHYDLGPLRRIGIGGAPTSEENKAALLELLPHVMIVDGYGASETGGMAFGATTRDSSRATTSVTFAPAAGAAVLAADRTRFLEPGDDEIGWTARRGRVPLGYLHDETATEATFPIVAGERLAVPGDRARIAANGTIELLGRDSLVVNTGGEKVFVEEVEQALRAHPDVVDALVVGRPSDRFGEEVVAVVHLVPGAEVTGADLREFSAESIARFKAPHAFAFTDAIVRHPSGKPDYRWAREVAADAVPVSSGP